MRGTKLAPFRSHDHIVQNLRNKFDLRINLQIDCASDSFVSIPVKVLEKLNNILSFFLFSLKFVSIVTVFVFFHCFHVALNDESLFSFHFNFTVYVFLQLRLATIN